MIIAGRQKDEVRTGAGTRLGITDQIFTICALIGLLVIGLVAVGAVFLMAIEMISAHI